VGAQDTKINKDIQNATAYKSKQDTTSKTTPSNQQVVKNLESVKSRVTSNERYKQKVSFKDDY